MDRGQHPHRNNTIKLSWGLNLKNGSRQNLHPRISTHKLDRQTFCPPLDIDAIWLSFH